MPLNDRQIKNAKSPGTGKKAKLFDGGLSYPECKAALFDMAASYRHHTSHAGFEIARGQGALQ